MSKSHELLGNLHSHFSIGFEHYESLFINLNIYNAT